MSETTFFATPADWRAWLEKHHASAPELSVGFWKKSITWPESVDEALCFGWIDGVRHRIDDEAYRIRFTPRRDGSTWSQVNLRRFEQLKTAGRIAPAGQAAFDAGKSTAPTYSYEREADELTAEETKLFRSNAAAWKHWRAFPPGYRKLSIRRVTSARRPETRARRLAALIDASAEGRKIDPVEAAAKPK